MAMQQRPELLQRTVVAGDLVLVHGFNSPENDAGKLLTIPPFAEALKGLQQRLEKKG